MAKNVLYNPEVGNARSVKVFINKDMERYPGGFESNVSQYGTEIVIQSNDAPDIARGDQIIDGSTVYEVQDRIPEGCDQFEITVSVK